MNDNLNWQIMETTVSAGKVETPESVNEKSLRKSVAIHQNGVLISDRIWVKASNVNAYGGDVMQPTPVSMTAQITQPSDLFALLKQFVEAIDYIKGNSDFLNDCKIVLQYDSNEIKLKFVSPVNVPSEVEEFD